MAIHNKSHSNHALMFLNKMRKDNNMKHKSSKDFDAPNKVKALYRKYLFYSPFTD